jgi:hypothetical protein
MTEFVEIIGADGRRRRARRGETLADGERFSLPMAFMDAQLPDALVEKYGGAASRVVDTAGLPAGHRPGFLGLDGGSAFADAAAEAYEERSRRLATAWQREGDDVGRHSDRENRVRDHIAPPLTLDQALAAAEAAREARDERLRTAWRTR